MTPRRGEGAPSGVGPSHIGAHTPDLPAIRARVEAATPGPWQALRDPAPSRVDHGLRLVAKTTRNDGANVYGLRDAMGWPGLPKLNSQADAEFIAHARQDVPALLAEVERLRGEVARLGLSLTHEGPELTKRVLDRAIAARPKEAP